MSQAAEFREKAAECIARAAQARDLHARVLFLQLASAWTSRANSIERKNTEPPEIVAAA
jgi:hypothetical protein